MNRDILSCQMSRIVTFPPVTNGPQVVAFTPCESQVEGLISGVLSFFFWCTVCSISFFAWHRVRFHNPVPLGPVTS